MNSCNRTSSKLFICLIICTAFSATCKSQKADSLNSKPNAIEKPISPWSKEDFQNVLVTNNKADVEKLVPLGIVHTLAKGTTVFSSRTDVNERAYKKIKMQAALMGGQVVSITGDEESGSNVPMPYSTGDRVKSDINGIAYTSQLPVYEDFINIIGDRKTFPVIESASLSLHDADINLHQVKATFTLSGTSQENGMITLNGNVKTAYEFSSSPRSYRVVRFSQNEFILFRQDGDTYYNYRVRLSN